MISRCYICTGDVICLSPNQSYPLGHPTERIDHFGAEDDAAQTGAAFEHIVGDMPHLRGYLNLGQRSAITERLFPNALQTLGQHYLLEPGTLIDGTVVDLGDTFRNGDFLNEGIGKHGIIEHGNAPGNTKLRQRTEGECLAAKSIQLLGKPQIGE